MQLLELDYIEDASRYFLPVSDMPSPVWLDSSTDRSLGGRYDIISSSPAVMIESTAGTVKVTNQVSGTSLETNDSPFDAIRAQLSIYRDNNPPSDAEDLPFSGGALGYWGYGLDDASPFSGGISDMRVGIYCWSLVVDHLKEKVWLAIGDGCSAPLIDNIKKRYRVGLPTSATTPDNPQEFTLKGFKAAIGTAHYRRSIEAIKDYISAGDCYQVNYSQSFSSGCSGNPLQAYLHLRSTLPSHYSAFMDFPGGSVLSLSPECFLTASPKGSVVTKPIKGTAPRHHCKEADSLSAEGLLASEKDRSENVMIVDLMRNDLGRVCDSGSVKVESLCGLESFANVHHLVSEVRGTLCEGVDSLALLESAFPAGSITGAPKLRATEIIAELETLPRSVYCGSIGYIGFDGTMDTSVAIRTLEISGDRIYCRGGGGIVADSRVESEYQESLDKVGVLMSALEEKFKH